MLILYAFFLLLSRLAANKKRIETKITAGTTKILVPNSGGQKLCYLAAETDAAEVDRLGVLHVDRDSAVQRTTALERVDQVQTDAVGGS